MKSRLTITVLVVVLLGVGAVILVWNRPTERTRREVNHWFHGYDWWNPKLTLAENHEIRKKAVAHLGVEAVSLLADDMQRPESSIKVFNRIVRDLLHHPFRAEQSFRAEAAYGLAMLGAKARNAVPQLINATKSGDGELEFAAVAALGAVALPETNVIAALSSLTNSRNLSLSFKAEVALWRLLPTNQVIEEQIKARIANPASLNNGDFHNVTQLGGLGSNAQVFVPALRAALTNKGATFGNDFSPRAFVASALWQIDRSTDGSFAVLTTLTNAIAQGVSQADTPGNILWLANIFFEIPEFCVAIKPLVQSINASTNASLATQKKAALERIERTLISTATNLTNTP